jgi:hypothetical protein
MLPEVVFDKTASNFIQNIDETDLKQPKVHRKIHTVPAYGFLKSQKNPRTKSLETFVKSL